MEMLQWMRCLCRMFQRTREIEHAILHMYVCIKCICIIAIMFDNHNHNHHQWQTGWQADNLGQM